MAKQMEIPEFSFVLLIGPSGSGKSSFAKKHFGAAEVISSDYCRFLVSNDENNQDATTAAFEVLRFIAAKRLERGLLTVIDATNLQRESRKPLLELARKYHVLPVVIMFDLPQKICAERNKARTDRNISFGVLQRQYTELRNTRRNIKKEGIRIIHHIDSAEEAETCVVERKRLLVDKRHEGGAFDIIGDIHGCFTELCELLQKLGYSIEVAETAAKKYSVSHPEGRRIIFLGDLVDRGPNTPEVLQLAMDTIADERAFCVVGNHDHKLLKALRGDKVQVKHGLQQSLEQLENKSAEFKARTIEFLDSLRSHFVFDSGKLVVAHAGLKEEMQGRASGAVRSFAMYGETTGEIDEYGLPVRLEWARDYRGNSYVVYGHTPVPDAEWVNHTLNIDTGCVFGGKLTALRYPELEIVDVPAHEMYYEPAKPLVTEKTGDTRANDNILDIADVTGKRVLQTAIFANLTVPEDQSASALEWMSRFAVAPRWLVYLPPTMSPPETSKREGYLEYPTEALEYFRAAGASTVICEEKHMGSRAVVVVCKDATAAEKHFGARGGHTVVGTDGLLPATDSALPCALGVVYTRTGRAFFSDAALEKELLERFAQALTKADFWAKFSSDWFCFDAEIMPWSLKAQSLLREQYAAVGAASKNSLSHVLSVLNEAKHNGKDTEKLIQKFSAMAENADKFTTAYRGYCWNVSSLADIKIAPFHLLASEGAVHTDKNHIWHMTQLTELCRHDTVLFKETKILAVNLASTEECRAAELWWEEMTANGGEGMVVKPLDFITKSKKGYAQPAVKCRGKEYLRIIYGPNYDMPENLERLRQRGLGRKRSLAMREFALGLESLERFVKHEPLYRVHECVFAVLALESEPVDPRL